MLFGPTDPTNIKRYADMKNTTDKRKRHKFTEIYVTKEEGKLAAASGSGVRAVNGICTQ